MTQITIRGIDEQLHQALRRTAENKGLSMNRYVLNLLKDSQGQAYGGPNNGVEFDDLDHLAGSWSQEEFEQFTEQLQDQRSIDSALWPPTP